MTNTETKITTRSPNQNDFLSDLTKNKTSVTIYLVGGIRLEGFLVAFDEYCLFLTKDGITQIVFKHAVATVLPSRPQASHDPRHIRH